LYLILAQISKHFKRVIREGHYDKGEILNQTLE